MKFEVINSNGRCMQSTTFPECIPYQFLESMASHGYRFRVDGKIVSKNRVKQAVDESLGVVSKNIITESDKVEILGVDLAASPDRIGNKEKLQSKGKPKIAIMCVEDNITFASQSEAAEHYGISPMSVSNSIKSGKPTKGHTFKKI
jgi:hypothetical protein